MGWKRRSALVLTGIMLLGSCFTVHAEETEPAGYHVYEVQEDEVSDNWYGIARGSYLQAGITKLLKDDSSHAISSGHTFAHRNCDRVYVRVYLDKSSIGTGGWGNVNYWTGEAFGNSMVSASSGSYKITRKNYYRVQGAHSATVNGFTETTTTCTNALYFD